MRVWRLVGARHAASALDGLGAARYGGRWNPVGIPVVYTSASLALATLELVVHLPGAHVDYVAIQLEVPDALVQPVDLGRLVRRWRHDEAGTQAIGRAWAATGALGLAVPSALVDERSGEGNVVINPRSPDAHRLRELQRFTVQLDTRLG